MSKIIDFRSDTLTKPSKAMKDFMFKAPLGDDVYKEDPSVNELEKYVAKLAKKEAALFVPSGTQSNLLALLSHCERGDEYICGQEAHIYKFEAGGGAVLGSIQPQPIEFEKDASLDLKKVKEKIKADDFHFAKTKLLCLENTHNGKVLSLKYLKKASAFAIKNNLLLHLDGARVFNAVVELDVKLSDITKYFDSISICLSKGLGSPVGSVLVGSKEFIEKAKRYRKMLGGAMRQSGIIASAGLYALKHQVKDLKKDHENARLLADELKKLDKIKVISNDTNMLFIKTKNPKALLEYLKENGILISGYGKMRIVVHRDILKDDIKKTVEVFKKY
ncbi:MAG: low-specificity L-threonine aldolase [Arcobacter sp.]|nr:low-specificity L-threonine aldolase [Arcobacter sp.]